jgi:CHASE2 domain-containing sensor protein
MPGSLLHANFIEALMDNRVYPPVPELLLTAVELVLLALGAMMFALELPMWRKIVAVVLACVALLLFNYFAIQNLGRFVDILVPLVFLVLHTVVDQVLDWRRDALRFARAKEGR